MHLHLSCLKQCTLIRITALFFLIYFNWRLITLQYCSGFCHTLIWISHGFTCVPHPEPPFHIPAHQRAGLCGKAESSSPLKRQVPLERMLTFMKMSSDHTSILTSLQSYPTLCDPMDCSPPSSSIHGILQARIQSGLPCPPPGDLPNPEIKPESLTSFLLAGGFFTTSTTYKKYITFQTGWGRSEKLNP